MVLGGCVADYPENPIPEELREMHAIMSEYLDDMVPLEDTSFSRKCQKVEKALAVLDQVSALTPACC